MKLDLDYKWLGIGIMFCLGFSGLGFVLSLITPILLPADLQCNQIKEDDWMKSPLHPKYKTLEDFINGCKDGEKLIVKMQQQVGFFMIIGFPVITGFIFFSMFGIHKKGVPKT